MRNKCLATAACLCIALASQAVPANTEQTVSLPLHQTSSLSDTGKMIPGTGNATEKNALNLLDTVWILGFTVAGLMLLRKVQGE